MNNSQERVGYSDEINLVDIAATFIRRRRVFYVTFTVFVLLGIIYALILPDKYEYRTLLQNAEKEGGEFIEQPGATVATIVNRWIPEVISNYEAQRDQNLPFGVEVMNPQNTGLIRISSESVEENKELVKKTHETIADNVIERQQLLLKKLSGNLENQIASMDDVIESLRTSASNEGAGAALAAAIQERAELKGNLQSLKPAEILVVSRQSTKKQGISGASILAFTVSLACLMGVFLTFFTEFVAHVRKRLNQGVIE